MLSHYIPSPGLRVGAPPYRWRLVSFLASSLLSCLLAPPTLAAVSEEDYQELVRALREECATVSEIASKCAAPTTTSDDENRPSCASRTTTHEESTAHHASAHDSRGGQLRDDVNVINHLFDYHGSDRGFNQHRYGTFYSTLFGKDRCKVQLMLEIGIGSVTQLMPGNMADHTAERNAENIGDGGAATGGAKMVKFTTSAEVAEVAMR